MLNSARYTWYIVFGGKRRHGRSPSDGVFPAVSTEAEPKTKPTESFTRQIKKYPLATAAIWPPLERQQHSTEPCHSNSKTRLLPPILRFSSSSWCECLCFTASRSCPYTCFFALKRPCKGPLTPQVFIGFLNLGAILANSLPGHPPFIPASARMVSDFPKYTYYAYIYLRGVRLRKSIRKNNFLKRNFTQTSGTEHKKHIK